jgi:hypothetical protein
MKRPSCSLSPNPTLFRIREASEPYSHGQWDSALKATPRSPEGDVSYVGALEQTVRSGAHGFRSRRPRSLLRVLNICRIRVSCSSTGSRPSPSRRLRSCCAISASSSRMRLTSTSRSDVFCGSSIALCNRLLTTSPLASYEYPRQSTAALSAMSIDRPQRRGTSGLTQHNPEVAVTPGAISG